MNNPSNVTNISSITQELIFGALAILVFSFTLSAICIAVTELDVTVAGLGHALASAALAAVALVSARGAIAGLAVLETTRGSGAARRKYRALASIAVVTGFLSERPGRPADQGSYDQGWVG